MNRRRYIINLLSIAAIGAYAANASAQVPWSSFVGTECDLINAANAELVILDFTRQLVIVTGPDVTLSDTVVNDLLDIFYIEGDVLEPIGSIRLALDGDGFESLWWVSLTGNVVNVDGFTGEPTETNMIPSDFFNVPCDACDFWDDTSVCEVIDGNTPPVTVEICGSSVTVSMIASLVGMSVMGLVSRRRW